MLISLSAEFSARVHIVHLATEAALPALRAARAKGVPVTVETCPHYLTFAAEEIPDGATLFKCAPPIRERATREALWRALEDGTIDLIATDHSPCPPEMKGGGTSSSLGRSRRRAGASRRGRAQPRYRSRRRGCARRPRASRGWEPRDRRVRQGRRPRRDPDAE